MLTFEGQEYLGTQAIMTKIAVVFFRAILMRRALVLVSPTTSRAWISSPPPTEAS